jgi:toxin secretion/phage lysis holin
MLHTILSKHQHTQMGLAFVRDETVYFTKQMLGGLPWKALLAFLVIPLDWAFQGQYLYVGTWFGFSVLDMLLGATYAIRQEQFCWTLLQGWVVKMITHMVTIILFGFLQHAGNELLDSHFPLVHWIVFILCITEALSILRNADHLALPVPKIASTLLQKLQKKANSQLDAALKVDEEPPK